MTEVGRRALAAFASKCRRQGAIRSGGDHKVTFTAIGTEALRQGHLSLALLAFEAAGSPPPAEALIRFAEAALRGRSLDTALRAFKAAGVEASVLSDRFTAYGEQALKSGLIATAFEAFRIVTELEAP